MSSSSSPPSSPHHDVPHHMDVSTPSTAPATRPQLHIDTTGTTPSDPRPSINSTPPRSRDGHSSINDTSLLYSSSIRSQRSDQPRVRFSADVQTLGERAIVSPSITTEEALARLQPSPSLSSLNRRGGATPSELPYLPSPQSDPIRGILRTPSQASGAEVASSPQQRRPARARGWSLRRQLWSKPETLESPTSRMEIGLSTYPSARETVPAPEYDPSRSSRTLDDVDAIRVVNAALDQARIDPPIATIHPNPNSPKKIPLIEPEVTQASLPSYSTWAASRRTRHFVSEKCKGLLRRLKRLQDPRLQKGNGREIPIDIPSRGKTHLLDERNGRDYVDNLITSSRYSVYSFLPRQLWAQFSKVANL